LEFLSGDRCNPATPDFDFLDRFRIIQDFYGSSNKGCACLIDVPGEFETSGFVDFCRFGIAESIGKEFGIRKLQWSFVAFKGGFRRDSFEAVVRTFVVPLLNPDLQQVV